MFASHLRHMNTLIVLSVQRYFLFPCDHEVINFSLRCKDVYICFWHLSFTLISKSVTHKFQAGSVPINCSDSNETTQPSAKTALHDSQCDIYPKMGYLYIIQHGQLSFYMDLHSISKIMYRAKNIEKSHGKLCNLALCWPFV